MRPILMVALCAAAFAAPAFAQKAADAPTAVAPAPSAAAAAAPVLTIRSGTYAIQGTAPDGTGYEGALQLQATGPQTWRIVWSIAGDTTTGAGLSVGNRLVFGYRSGGETGTGFYETQPDGRLVGRWTQGAQGGVGMETLLPR